MGWNGDHFTAKDGRVFVIFTERVRGEGVYHWALRLRDDSPRLPGERVLGHASPGDERWLGLPFDGSSRKATVQRRVERYVRETTDV